MVKVRDSVVVRDRLLPYGITTDGFPLEKQKIFYRGFCHIAMLHGLLVN